MAAGKGNWVGEGQVWEVYFSLYTPFLLNYGVSYLFKN